MNRHLLGPTLAALALIMALSAAAAPRAQAQEPDAGSGVGAINIIQPEIYLTPSNGEEGRIGMPTTIAPGERLRTNRTGVALITWLRDGTETVLGPGTEIALERFAGDREAGFDVALTHTAGQLSLGIGDLGAAGGASVWRIATPAFEARLMQGRFELRVGADGQTTLAVIEGSADITRPGGEALRVSPHEFVTARPGEVPNEAQPLSPDGVEVVLTGVCTGEARANVNVRLAPSESSRRLGGLVEGQRFWVRAATEGRLWLQIYYRTSEDDREAHNFGWVYGPIATLDEALCADLMRAPLDAQIFGGPGIGGDRAAEDTGEEEAVSPAEIPTATPDTGD